MESYIAEVCSFEDIDISGYKKKMQYDEKAIEKSLTRLANRYIVWTDGETVSMGDVVECRILSNLREFQGDKISLTVGAGLFDPEIENMLKGKHKGDIFMAKKEGKDVTFEILSVRNKHIPELRDEFVTPLEIPNVHTVAEYKEYLYRQQFEDAFYEDSYEPLIYIQKKVLERSRIVLKREDWQKYIDLKVLYLKGIASFDGLDLETMTEEDFEGRIPVKSYTELIVMLQNEAWDYCQLAILGKYYADQDNVYVSKSGYKDTAGELAEGWKKTAEEICRYYSFDLYKLDFYADYYGRKIMDYLREKLYVEED